MGYLDMKEPLFDLFSGQSEKDAVWRESVEGFANARKRMEQMAASVPGPYFLYSPLSHSILARTDTARPLLSAREEKKAGAA
jgi:hypothetical protein